MVFGIVSGKGVVELFLLYFLFDECINVLC